MVDHRRGAPGPTELARTGFAAARRALADAAPNSVRPAPVTRHVAQPGAGRRYAVDERPAYLKWAALEQNTNPAYDELYVDEDLDDDRAICEAGRA